ncbi:acetyl-CoA acetyltransferase [Nocardia mangyaensis]|uniref:Acetyl-CoA acetyltransferase n=1 Tax=Nocardia mangyaensis TaxID=2213200 RepID=A0A1J0VRM7_9NOCA|nr:acetyl-CoA C-acyltransferase [Nocardia mangyaensis]APE34704.1 acetyl-CoA acetyltransferase [Nocardia mangyaensis]
MTRAVIVDAVRTASGRGKPGGALAEIHPAALLAQTLQQLISRSDLDPELVEDVLAGCVVQVGDQALNIARTAALAAGLPEDVAGTTIDRQCGSSQQATHFAAQGVISGTYDIVIACGVESMSRVPMGTNVQVGAPFAPLSERYPEGMPHQGIGAELMAARWGLDRAALDAFASQSHRRASEALASGMFTTEIVPVALPDGREHWIDETVRTGTTVEKLAGLRSAFREDAFSARFPEIEWMITAGNSSPLTDGASAVLIMSEDRASKLGLTPRAAVHTMTVTGSDPTVMLSGVIPATRRALTRSGLDIDDIDTFEVNEAFASVPLAWAKEFDVHLDKVNPRGGALALGHPLGSSGTRLLTTMLTHLEASGGRFGLQTMCEGGGMANATIIERI